MMVLFSGRERKEADRHKLISQAGLETVNVFHSQHYCGRTSIKDLKSVLIGMKISSEHLKLLLGFEQGMLSL